MDHKDQLKYRRPGAIRAAQKTGAIIIPAAGQSTKHWSFKNWDTFYLAKPFGKIVQLFGEPIILKEEDDYTNPVLNKLKNALNKLEKEAKSSCWHGKPIKGLNTFYFLLLYFIGGLFIGETFFIQWVFLFQKNYQQKLLV